AAQHAYWLTLPLYALDRLQELRPRTAPARTSLQQMVAFVADEAARAATTDLAARRFGRMPAAARSWPTPPSCASTSPRCTNRASSASTCGSPTSPPRARCEDSATT